MAERRDFFVIGYTRAGLFLAAQATALKTKLIIVNDVLHASIFDTRDEAEKCLSEWQRIGLILKDTAYRVCKYTVTES